MQGATVLVVGVGALGSVAAERLVRAGIGRIKLVDRDWVEPDNLPRQMLYTAADAAQRRPKAIAAAEHLEAIDGDCRIEPHVTHFGGSSMAELGSDCDLWIDGTDNFESRFAMNDAALHLSKPWIHAGILGTAGQAMAIVPRHTCCLRCIIPTMPPADQMQSCHTAGVLGSSVAVVASFQVTLAIRYLIEGKASVDNRWYQIETWPPAMRPFVADPEALRPTCPACGPEGQLTYLDDGLGLQVRPQCGRNAVQISGGGTIDFFLLSQRLGADTIVQQNPYFLRAAVDQMEVTLFRDGRCMISGTEEPAVARRLYHDLMGG